MGWAFGYYENPVRNDALALASVDRWAYHGYTDGVTPDPGSFDGSTETQKAVWMTETCCFGSTIAQAQNIHNTLGPGRGSAYMYWAFSELFSEGVQNFRWQGIEQYAKVIRPGAKQIQTSGTGGVSVVAFSHTGDNTMAIVVINSGGQQSLNLTGSGIPANLDIYQCTNGSPSRMVGSMTSSETITLPAGSVTSLYNTPATSLRDRAERNWAQLQNGLGNVGPASIMKVYSIDGRLVSTTPVTSAKDMSWSSNTAAAGIYFGLICDAKGQLVRTVNLSAKDLVR
jgi:glycosyl hydrolase family 30